MSMPISIRATLLPALVTIALLTLAACGDDDGEPQELVLLTHASFDATDAVLARFEEEHNATVTIVEAGDANELVNRAVLSAGNPEGDVLFGIDNLIFPRVVEAEVFEPYTPEARGTIPADILAQFGDSDLVTPIDYGYVNINMDASVEQEPPATFEDLLDEQWRGQLVVLDPATSSPGLQFLVSTIAHFGEGGWQDFWRGLRENDVLITDGWTDAYYTQFSLYGGDRTLVVSYTTSPAAEVFFGEGLTEPPSINVIPDGVLFRQVEAAGVLRGTDEPELARAFIDFMLSEEFQTQIPETMFVYPVMNTETPEWWSWANVEVTPATVQITEEQLDAWLSEWTAIMRQ
jgi:thiamine transport system substrate-binding protein